MSISVARRLSAALAPALLACCFLGGTAAAYWSAPGTGSGSATSGTLTFSLTGVVSGSTLYPGTATDLSVSYTLTGPAARVISIAAGAIPEASACGVSFAPPASYMDARYSLSGSGTFMVPAAVSTAISSPSTCQGQSFTIPLTVTVQL